MSVRPWFRSSVLRLASVGSALLLILAMLIPVRGTQAQTTSDQVVSWVHIGDLHMVDTTLSNYSDLKTIVNDINSYMKDGVNFALLPGDNANDGAESEYQLVHGVIQNLQVPLKAVPGDHDSKGPTTLFLKYIYPKMPDSFDFGNYHFVLYDSFNLQNVLPWLTSDLNAAKAAGKQSVIFQHEYDINSCCSALQALIQNDNVIMVDTGHTHSNVLANDGHTVYSATRSTGQATEGPVGFSVNSLDHGVVSWKFQPLGQWPFVSITSPADQALLTNGEQVVKGTTSIHVKAFSDASINSVSYQIDGGAKVAMSDRGGNLWSGSWNSSGVSDGAHTIDVSVTDANGKTGTDEIKALVDQAGSYAPPTKSFGPENNVLPASTIKGLLGATGAGGGKGGGKGGVKGGGKGGAGPGACATSGTTPATTTPAPPAPPATTATAASGASTAQPAGGKGGKGGAGPATCTTSSTTTATPTATATGASSVTQPSGGPGKGGKGGHGCGGPGGKGGGPGGKGGKGGKHGGASGVCSPSAAVTPTPNGITP